MLHFYDGQIRRYVTQLVRMMSNFTYKDGANDVKTVPVLYGDLTRQVASIIKENSENKLPSVPRMALYITGLEVDRNRTSDSSFVSKVQVRERAYDDEGNEYLNTQGKNYTVERLMPVPYNLSVNVDIWTSNTDQKLQILEQILMLFNPSLELQTTDNFLDWTSLSVVNLEQINFSNRTIPVGTESEIDIATLGFTTPIYISPPVKVKRLGIITNIITSIYNESAGTIELGLSRPQQWAFADIDVTATTTQASNNGEVDFNVKNTVGSNSNNTTTFNTSWKNLGIFVFGNTVKLIENGNLDTVMWKALFDIDPTGCYTAGMTQLRLQLDNGNYVIGYVSINEDDPYVLDVEWDTDTLPSNTIIEGPARNENSWASLDYIIDPMRWDPTQQKSAGLRLMILGDIGNVNNTDGPDAWKNNDGSDFVAGENDIIEWDGQSWSVVFDASNETSETFVTNLATGAQYKWTGEFWTKSYEGEYPTGAWRIIY